MITIGFGPFPGLLRRLRHRMAEPVTRYDGAVTERAEGGLMAAPRDRTAEHEQTHDSVRTRESDPIGAELPQRMERLPPRHPSSPYNDDASRTPPVPNPFEAADPIPGDPDYRPGTRSTPKFGRPQEDPSKGVGDLLHAVDKGVTAEELTSDSEADHVLDPEETPRNSTDGSMEWK